MPECDSCGANVDAGERECPYCGHSFVKHIIAARPETKDPQTFSLDRESGTVHFGDGVSGKRPRSGRDVGPEKPRTGYEPMFDAVCPKCGHKNSRARVDCDACGAPLRKAKTRFPRKT